MKKLLIILGVASVVYACGNGQGSKEPEVKPPADTPGVTSNAPAEDFNTKALELIGSNDCTTCHAINEKKIGPAYIDVSKKYEATDAEIDTLVNKVIHGGQGNWGTVPMTPHPTLSRDDAKIMVKYILSLKNQ